VPRSGIEASRRIAIFVLEYTPITADPDTGMNSEMRKIVFVRMEGGTRIPLSGGLLFESVKFSGIVR